MPAQLLALNDGPSILLDKPIMLLGRDLECDIRLDSRKISRRHCCIAQVGVQLVVRDLGSTNGVRINGIRVVEGYLKVGDEFTIGNFRYQVRWDSVAAVGPGMEKVEMQMDRHLSTDKPPAEDDILEECEEPVPLSDPSPAEQAAPAKAPVATVPPAAGVAAPVPRNPHTQILPDEEEMELAPPSDVKAPRPPEAPEQKPA